MRNHTATDARVLNVNTTYRYDNPDSELNGANVRVLLDRGRYCACRVAGKFVSRRKPFTNLTNPISGDFGYLYKGFLTELP